MRSPELCIHSLPDGNRRFFGWANFGKSHEVLRGAFLVIVLLMLTATRFLKNLFFWASDCL